MLQARVLILESDPFEAESLGFAVTAIGYQAFVEFDGQRAVEVATYQQPDVILLETTLHGACGSQLCRRLREMLRGKHAYIVAMNGSRYQDDGQACTACFDGHLQKPIDVWKLKEFLDERLARTRAQRRRRTRREGPVESAPKSLACMPEPPASCLCAQ